jgi:hypothetical protein
VLPQCLVPCPRQRSAICGVISIREYLQYSRSRYYSHVTAVTNSSNLPFLRRIIRVSTPTAGNRTVIRTLEPQIETPTSNEPMREPIIGEHFLEDHFLPSVLDIKTMTINSGAIVCKPVSLYCSFSDARKSYCHRSLRQFCYQDE